MELVNLRKFETLSPFEIKDELIKLAKKTSLLNGGGFEAPDWSLRVSLANLPDEVYKEIGRGVRSIARAYRDAYEASKHREEMREPALPPSVAGLAECSLDCVRNYARRSSRRFAE